MYRLVDKVQILIRNVFFRALVPSGSTKLELILNIFHFTIRRNLFKIPYDIFRLTICILPIPVCVEVLLCLWPGLIYLMAPVYLTPGRLEAVTYLQEAFHPPCWPLDQRIWKIIILVLYQVVVSSLLFLFSSEAMDVVILVFNNCHNNKARLRGMCMNDSKWLKQLTPEI